MNGRPGGPRLCMLPQLSGIGGMVSFQRRLAAGLARRGVEVTFDPADDPYQALLVIGGTRRLGAILRARRRGVPVIQRLDGMNWLHRLVETGFRHFLRAEYGNLVLSFIRRNLADRVIYQSEFVARWWQRTRGPLSTPATVIYNGVDLAGYTPEGPHERPVDRYRLLLVEGSLMGGYELGLEHAVRLANALKDRADRPLELMIAGRVADPIKAHWEQQSSGGLRWAGPVPHDQIPFLDRSAHVLFSADLNPACPNAVIEALACGLPVIAFATGALPEMVDERSGQLAPYGGDPWRLDPPDFGALANAALAVLSAQPDYRRGARRQAEARFDLEHMVDGYLAFLMGG